MQNTSVRSSGMCRKQVIQRMWILMGSYRGFKDDWVKRHVRRFPSNPKFRKFLLVHQMNGPFRFGPYPKYSGPALKVVLFDLSGNSGQPVRHARFRLTKVNLSPVPLFYILLARSAVARVVSVMYCSIGHMEFPKFQTGIFVEWKAPVV